MMFKKNIIIDDSFRFLLTNDSLIPKSRIILTENGSEADLNGIDGWLYNGEKWVPFSMRGRTFSSKYNCDIITFTSQWKSGNLGEWQYSLEFFRIHAWFDNYAVPKKIMFVRSDKDTRKKLQDDGKAELAPINTENEQYFMKIKTDEFRKRGLVYLEFNRDQNGILIATDSFMTLKCDINYNHLRYYPKIIP